MSNAARLSTFILSAFLVISPSATAASLSLATVNGDPFVRLSGEIEKGDQTRFAAFVSRQKQKPHGVILASPGGSLGEGLAIGRYVRRNDMTTLVRRQESCASSCVFVFAGGVIREAEPGARVGVHMASRMWDDSHIGKLRSLLLRQDTELSLNEKISLIVSVVEQGAAIALSLQAAYYIEMGISPRILVPNVETHHFDVYWLSPTEMHSFNLTNTR